jgi:hypothetical protein
MLANFQIQNGMEFMLVMVHNYKFMLLLLAIACMVYIQIQNQKFTYDCSFRQMREYSTYCKGFAIITFDGRKSIDPMEAFFYSTTGSFIKVIGSKMKQPNKDFPIASIENKGKLSIFGSSIEWNEVDANSSSSGNPPFSRFKMLFSTKNEFQIIRLRVNLLSVFLNLFF